MEDPDGGCAICFEEKIVKPAVPVSCFLSKDRNEFHEHTFCEECLKDSGFRKTTRTFREVMRLRDREKESREIEKVEQKFHKIWSLQIKVIEQKFHTVTETFRQFKESVQGQSERSQAEIRQLERKLTSAESQRNMYKRLYMGYEKNKLNGSEFPVTPRRSTREAAPSEVRPGPCRNHISPRKASTFENSSATRKSPGVRLNSNDIVNCSRPSAPERRRSRSR